MGIAPMIIQFMKGWTFEVAVIDYMLIAAVLSPLKNLRYGDLI